MQIIRENKKDESGASICGSDLAVVAMWIPTGLGRAAANECQRMLKAV
jgi:hypothetical protein